MSDRIQSASARPLRDINPGWEHRLWTEKDLPALGIGEDEHNERARTQSYLT